MKGFVVIAQNNDSDDYLKMAYMLALNLKITQSEHTNLTVIKSPDMNVPEHYAAVFDQVIDLPVDDATDDEWKIQNKWQVYQLSPYDHTLYVDADMYFPVDFSPVWSMLEGRPFAITTKAKNYRGEALTSRLYRRAFDHAGLDDVYSAMVYFEKGPETEEVFTRLRDVYHNWEIFRGMYAYNLPNKSTGDLAFAVTLQTLFKAHIYTEFPGGDFVHLKMRAQNGDNFHYMREDWTFHMHYQILEDGGLTINEFKQNYPVHYVDKSFASDDMISKLEQMVP